MLTNQKYFVCTPLVLLKLHILKAIALACLVFLTKYLVGLTNLLTVFKELKHLSRPLSIYKH